MPKLLRFLGPLAGFATPLALAIVVSDTPAKAQTVDDVTKAVSAIPAMEGIAVSDVKQSGAFFTAKLGTKKHAATVFNLGTAAKPIWNIALYPSTLKLSQVYKTGTAALLGGLETSAPAVVVSAATGSGDIAKLPAPVQSGIKKVFGTAIKQVTFPGGVNFSFSVDPARTKAIDLVRASLSLPTTKVPMAGQMGADLVRYLANGKAATQPADLASVSLTTVLGAGKPPASAPFVSAQGTAVLYKGDAKGQVTLQGQSTLGMMVGNSAKPLKAAVVFDDKATQAILHLTDTLTVKDLFGPTGTAIDALPVKSPVVGSDHIAGSIPFRGVETPLVIVQPQKNKPILALLHKAFPAASYLPSLTGSTLEGANLRDVAMIVVPKGASAGAVAAKDLAGPLGAMVKAGIGTMAKFALNEGLNLVGAIDVGKSAALKKALGYAGIKQPTVPFAGRISADLLKNPTQPAAAGLKADTAAILASLDMSAAVSPPKIPGLEKAMTIAKPSLHIHGQVDDKTKAVSVATDIDGSMQLKVPGKNLTLLGSVALNSDPAKGLEFRGSSQTTWPGAFGISFISMHDIGFTGSSKTGAKGKQAISLILDSGVRIGAAAVRARTTLVLSNGEIADFELGLPEGTQVAGLPVFNSIPRINDFAFRHIKISGLGLYGELVWKPLNLTTQFAMVRARDGQMGMIIRLKDITLGEMSKEITGPFASLKLPTTAVTFSLKNMLELTRQSLPPGIQPILDGIADRPDDRIPITEGVNIIAAVGERDFPEPLHGIVEKIGVFDALDGPLLLMGKIPDPRKGKKQFTFYASLPGVNLPKNQPLSRLVSFDQVRPDFFMRGNPLAQAFQIGAAGNLTISVPHLDNGSKVDKLKFRGEVFASIDPVSPAGSFKVSGTMQGKWRNPFGLNNFAIENPAFLVGWDGEAAVEFGVGGNMEFAARNKQKITYGADFLLNLNLSTTIPAPKKLGVRIQSSKTSSFAMLEIGDALMRGVLTGPMAQVVAQALPADAKKEVQKFQAAMKKGSLLDLMKIDQLPIPQVQHRDIDFYFATPGAYIPGREKTLPGLGFVVAGKAELVLMGRVTPLAELDTRLTLVDGFKIYGKMPAISLGPLELGTSIVDIAATLDAPPHFKIKGNAYLLGTSQVHDIELSKDKIKFFFDRNLGPVIKLHVDANTIGKDLMSARDFTVNASTTSDLDKAITNDVLPKLGIPKAVAENIRKSNPLYIRGGTFSGSLTDFIKGKDVVLSIDHKYFGQQMEPAVIKFKPAWKDPASAFPAVKIAHAMTISLARYLAAHPVKIADVDLGLVKITEAKLQGFVDPKEKALTKFVVGGKSSFLGASRKINVTLSDSGYAFDLKDKIAGGLWQSELRAWSIGGTALAPADIKYYGTLNADFYTWLKKAVGRELNKNYDNIGALYKKAQADLLAAEGRVRTIDTLIAAKRAEASRELGALQSAFAQAIKAVDHTKWIRDQAFKVYVAAEKQLAAHINSGWYLFKFIRTGALTLYKETTRNAFNIAEDAYKAAQAIVNELRRKPSQISVDLHPKVAPLIVARQVAVGALQTVRLGFAAAEGMNNGFKKITNDLVNAVAGTKVLVIKKAVFTGSVKQAKADLHMNLDILNTKDLFMRLKVNLLNPQETDLRELAHSIMSVIKGQQVASSAKTLPPPPKLPPMTVPKVSVVKAVVAEIKAKAAAAAPAAPAASSTVNLAKGRPVRQSTVAVGGVAGRAVDGNTNGNWGGNSVTHTADQVQAWWQVDLGNSYQIDTIRIHNRTDCCGARLNDAIVMVSDKPFPGTQLTPRSGDGIHRWSLGAAKPLNTIAVGRTGRHVLIQLPGKNPLSLAEVEVIGKPGAVNPGTPKPAINLAKGRPARQSSVAVGGVANRAVDGNANGNWNANSVTHTNDQTQAWWQVDLGKSHQIDTIRLHNRTDCCGARLDNAVVMVSDQPFAGTPLTPKSGDGIYRSAIGVAKALNTVNIGRSGRYVRIQLPGKNPLSLAEVEVMGR